MKTQRILALEARRDELTRRLEEMNDSVINRGSELTEDEKKTYNTNSDELKRAIDEHAELVEREASIQRSIELGNSLGNGTKPGAQNLAGNDGEAIYRGDEGETQYLLDVYKAKYKGDRKSADRLDRAADSADGITVPKYAMDKYVEIAKPRRAFLNTLPGGRLTSPSVIVPVQATGVTVEAQTAENTEFAHSDLDVNQLTLTATTAGGYTDVSVQAVDWGILKPSYVFTELLRTYFAEQDYLALHGTGANGQPEGLFNADNTSTIDGSTTSSVLEHLAAIQEAASKIETIDFREVQYALMSPARWRALSSAGDTTGRPVMGFNGSHPMNVAGVDQNGVKWFGGIRVITDPNVVMRGEDDTFMAVYNTDAFYWEDTDPKTLACDCVLGHTGTVRFIVRGYQVFTAEVRPKSLVIINDLTPPEFPTLPIS